MTTSQLRTRRRTCRDGLLEATGKRRRFRLLFAELLEPRRLLATVTGVTPLANSHIAPPSTGVIATFDQNINAATATPQSFVVHSTQRGSATATVSTAGPTVTVNLDEDFFPGELVQATVTSAIQGTAPANPRVWQFRTATAGGTGTFTDTSQVLSGAGQPAAVSLGDLDNDGDLDAFVTNFPRNQPSRVWLNNGGVFFDSGQRLGVNRYKLATALGDLDGDGDLDAFVANGGGSGGNHVWLNNGNALFSDSGQNIDTAQGQATRVSLGDVDNDGDLDAVVLVTYSGNKVFLNDGTGRFVLGQAFPPPFYNHGGVALGDLDGDGDLDIYFSKNNDEPADTVWFNDGRGQFSDSGQRLGGTEERHVVLGDIDGDGDLDALVQANPSYILWVNNGAGVFTNSGQNIGPARTAWPAVSLGDLDGDNDLDVFVGGNATQVWFNNGNGQFEDSGQSLGNNDTGALGDLDGDGDLDAFLVSSTGNRVWLNQNAEPSPPSVILSVDRATVSEAGGSAVILATLSGTATVPVTVDLATSGTAMAPADYALSIPQIVIPSGNIAGSVTLSIVDDDLDEPRETIVVDITSVTNATEAGTQQVTVTIIDDDGPIVVGTAPPPNSHDAPVSTNITATLDEVINGTTASPQSLVVHGAQRGRLLDSAATVSTADATVMFDPTADFFPGELVQASITSTLQTISGATATPHVWQFRTAVTGGSGQFSDSGQLLENQRSWRLSLGDLDGDGDLDAFVGNAVRDLTRGNSVWLNNGGQFTDTGQVLGMANSLAVAMGDLDGDGDLDAFVANVDGAADRVWLNGGTGQFSDSGQSLGDHDSSGAALGDLDGDGDLDAFVTSLGQGSRVWLNNGGQFAASGQFLEDFVSNDVSLGDVDGDGDLDAFVVNGDQPNRVWLNDGYGFFLDSGQNLGNHRSTSVELGDVDDDGDLDAFVGNYGEPNRVWLNDGGQFSDSGQMLGDHKTLAGVALGDLDGDGDLDAFAGNSDYQGDRVWVNNGNGAFVASGQTLGDHESRGVALGDLDGDGDLDALVAGYYTNQIWINQNPVVPSVTLSADPLSIPEADGAATITATLSEITTVPVEVDLTVSGSASPGSDFIFGTTTIVVAPGAASGSVTVTAVQDLLDEPDETIVVKITEVRGGTEAGVQQQTITIVDDDLPPTLMVGALVPTDSGFVAEFNADLDDAVLNVYDTQSAGLGAADVLLTGAITGPVNGSLVVDRSLRRVTFLKTGGPLLPDTYTVNLRSASDGFKDTDNRLLDGNGDGTPGDDLVTSFVVDEPAASTITVRLGDFVRGPGQPVNVPADDTIGIPVSISNGTNVRAIDLRIAYDPEFLEISAATVGADMPAGASVILNTNTPGLAIVVLFSTTPLPVDGGTILNLAASVPSGDVASTYGSEQVLDVHNVTISDGNDNEFPVIVDDALHLMSYFGDVSGNRRVNASDAAQLARFAALLETGFNGSLLVDPQIQSDISGNGRVNAVDASLVAQFAALIDVPEIPAVPLAAGNAATAQLPHDGVPLGSMPVSTSTLPSADNSFASVSDTTLEHPVGERRPVRDAAHDAVFSVLAGIASDGDEEMLVRDLEDAINDLLQTSEYDLDFREAGSLRR